MNELQRLRSLLHDSKKRGDNLISFALTESQAGDLVDAIINEPPLGFPLSRQELLRGMLSGQSTLFGLPVRVVSGHLTDRDNRTFT